MNLTIEQVAAYLPYKVNGLVHISASDTDYIDEIDGIEVRGFYTDISLGGVDTSLHNLKLILRTMSEADQWCRDNNVSSCQEYNLCNYSQLPYNIFQTLISVKFDVFGLIDQGLAVSCYDIEVSYE